MELLVASLIGRISTFPLRNQKEFEKITGVLGDPHRTVSANLGTIEGLKKLLKSGIKSFDQDFSSDSGGSESQGEPTKQNMTQSQVDELF